MYYIGVLKEGEHLVPAGQKGRIVAAQPAAPPAAKEKEKEKDNEKEKEKGNKDSEMKDDQDENDEIGKKKKNYSEKEKDKCNSDHKDAKNISGNDSSSSSSSSVASSSNDDDDFESFMRHLPHLVYERTTLETVNMVQSIVSAGMLFFSQLFFRFSFLFRYLRCNKLISLFA